MKHTILHITVHLGGGVGSVIMNWIKTDTENSHTILCLNNNYYKTYDTNIVHENMRHKQQEIIEWVDKSDIVVVHFWNHPLLYKFITVCRLPPCRLCIWSHISGFNPPYVFSDKLIAFSDRFVFASPISYNTPEIISLPPEEKTKLGHIWTTGNIDEYSKVSPISHDGFNIGFIGTLDYSKLHPNFIDFCSKIDIPDVKFIICGDGCDADKIKQQVKDKGLEDKFLFTGVIDDIKPYLSIIDVFGYPLNPTHFGTCEQVLGEAIAAGIIPVVMNNPAEEYILFQSLVKFVCTTEQEYVHNIELLYNNKQRQNSLINLIQENIISLYSSNNMIESWNTVFKEQMETPKKNRSWFMSKKRRKMGGAGMFLDSIGKYGTIFESNDTKAIKNLFKSNLQWFSNSKGSPRQYLNTFPNDKHLIGWVNLLEELEQGD